MAAGYSVTGQRQRTILGADGRPAEVITVTFSTTSGGHGSVDVPLDGYTPESVRKAIEERVAVIDAVAGL